MFIRSLDLRGTGKKNTLWSSPLGSLKWYSALVQGHKQIASSASNGECAREARQFLVPWMLDEDSTSLALDAWG